MAEVKYKTGTPITWKNSGGTYAITLASLAASAARQGVKGDLGASWARQYLVTFVIETGSVAPLAGQAFDLFWASSTNATPGSENPGGTSGTDIAYKAGEVAEWALQLEYIGTMLMTNDATTIQRVQLRFSPMAQYGMPVVFNRTSQTIEANDDEHRIIFTPIIDEIQ